MRDSFNEGSLFETKRGKTERPVQGGGEVSAFFLRANETTRAEWGEVQTWVFANGYDIDNPGGSTGPRSFYRVRENSN